MAANAWIATFLTTASPGRWNNESVDLFKMNTSSSTVFRMEIFLYYLHSYRTLGQVVYLLLDQVSESIYIQRSEVATFINNNKCLFI